MQRRGFHGGIRVAAGAYETFTTGPGDFTLVLPAGQYDLTAGHSLYLQRCMAVNTGGGDVSLPTFQLLGGDINGDKVIGIADLVSIGAAYGSFVTRGAPPDIDASGQVDLADLVMVGGNYNEATPSSPCPPLQPLPSEQSDAEAKAAPAGRLVVQAPERVKAGETFTVEVAVRDRRSVAAADVRLRFDPRQLALVGDRAEVGAFFDPAQAFVVRNQGDARQGEWTFTAVRLGDAPATDGRLFSLCFRALRSGPVRIAVEADLAGRSGPPISSNWER